MKVRIITIVILVGLLAFVWLSGTAQGKTSSQLHAELETLQDQAADIAADGAALQAELDANAQETRSTIEQKSAIDQAIHNTEAQLQNAEAQLQCVSLLIAQSQSDLEAAQQEQQALQEAYRQRLRAMEENGDVSYWAVLFGASSFQDLLSRIDMIHEVAEADQAMLRSLQEKADEVAAQQETLRQELDEQAAIRAELEAMEATLETQRAQADELLLALLADEAALSEEYQKNLEREDALRQEILAAQQAYEAALSAEEAARLAQSNANNVAGGGGSTSSPGATGLIAPVDGPHVITDAYGWRDHPVNGKVSFHHGVDFAKNQGTAIYAVAAGTVTGASYDDINGYHVSVSHGNGYGSIYCHMTNYIVSPGDSVAQGQVLGYVGSTGLSTGPHLHFELHINGASVNPASYLPLA